MSSFDFYIKEQDFVEKLYANEEMFDASGNITEAGKVTESTYLARYDAYMKQAQAYKQMAQKYDQLAKESLSSGDTAQYHQYIEQYQEYVELQQEAILGALDEKEAMIDLAREGIDKQTEATQELVDAKKEQLEAEKDLHDYEKSITEKTKNIASIQKRIAALQNDDSEEAKKELRKLRAELTEAQEDLEETQYQHSIEEQEEALDKFMEDYEKSQEERKKDTITLFSQEMDEINSSASSTLTSILNTTMGVGYSISDNLITTFATAGDVFTGFANGVEVRATSLTMNLENMFSKMFKDLSSLQEELKKTQAAMNQEDYSDSLGTETTPAISTTIASKYPTEESPDVKKAKEEAEKKNKIISMLNDSDNHEKNQTYEAYLASSDLNKVLVNTEYQRLSGQGAANIAKELGLGDYAAGQVEKNVDNIKEKILTELKKLGVVEENVEAVIKLNDFSSSSTTDTKEASIKAVLKNPVNHSTVQVNEDGSNREEVYKSSSELNKKLMDSGYKRLSYQGALNLATSLGLKDFKLEDIKNNKNDVKNLMLKELQNLGLVGFATGGIIRTSGVSTEGNKVMIRVNPNETILTEKFTNILPDVMHSMDSFVKIPNINTVRSSGTNVQNSFGDINVNLPNATNPKEFANALKNSNLMQEAIQASIEGRMMVDRL